MTEFLKEEEGCSVTGRESKGAHRDLPTSKACPSERKPQAVEFRPDSRGRA